MTTYVVLLILLILIATGIQDDFALTLIYLLVGAFGIGLWWSRRSIHQVAYKRTCLQRAFLGEEVEVDLELSNQGWLPLPWVSVEDGLPVALSTAPSFKCVTSLGPRGTTRYRYRLTARKRGYYPVGPLFVSGGDLLGMTEPLQLEGPVQYLTVYPKIVPLHSVEIPSRSPQGTLRHNQPIFEDPTRSLGKRDYAVGDSLRRVDWKSSAATGRLQVKLFEPSIALETLIFLDLNAEDYHYRNRIDSIELAVVIAASVATWVADKQQTVGLRVNGKDLLMPDALPQYIPPRKGQAQLMRILETLARVEMTEGTPFPPLVRRQRYHVAWGTTLLVITGQVDDELLDELYQARRAGQNVKLILAGSVAYFKDIRDRAAHFGIPAVSISNERGLDIWRH